MQQYITKELRIAATELAIKIDKYVSYAHRSDYNDFFLDQRKSFRNKYVFVRRIRDVLENLSFEKDGDFVKIMHLLTNDMEQLDTLLTIQDENQNAFATACKLLTEVFDCLFDFLNKTYNDNYIENQDNCLSPLQESLLRKK